jgi:hypothetical protein
MFSFYDETPPPLSGIPAAVKDLRSQKTNLFRRAPERT